MIKNRILLTLLLITCLGGFLRFYNISNNPPSLTGDEISFGYSAYSVLKTGHDEFGVFLPLTFQSVGDYKNPVPVYLMIPAIGLFGLNDFAVRFPNALIGTLAIPLFFLFLRDIFKDKKIALVGAFLLSISAWHISYSRFSYETLMASVFVMLAIWFYMKMLGGQKYWGVASAFFFVLTMYTAFAARLFVPIIILAMLVINHKTHLQQKSRLAVFIGVCVILALPLLYVSFFQGAGTRLTMVLLSNDIEFSRYILFHGFESIWDLPWLFFFWARRYLSYLDPGFLFFNGLNMTQPGSVGLGIFYPFELPFLILGVIDFVRRKMPYKSIFVIWLIIGIIPDSLTNNQQHSGRLLQIAPVLITLTTLGAIKFFYLVKNLKSRALKIAVSGSFGVFVILVLIHAFLTFSVHYPDDKGESFDEGLKQVALYANAHKNEYSKIVIDPRRGVDGPYIISNPYLYVLFYSKYDPQKYQTEPRLYGEKDNPNYRFDKYEFRYIDWHSDNAKVRTLFIGSPWSFPQEGVKPGELLDKIYLSNGEVAFYVVAPR